MVIRILVSLLTIVLFSCSSSTRDKSKENKEDKTTTQAEAPVQTVREREMVSFEGGTFKMGSAAGTQAEQPVHEVKVNAFRIDKYPVTVADFRRFVEAAHYQTDAERFGDSGVFDFTANGWTLMPGAYWEYPLGKKSSKAEDNHPVTHVSWNDATAYAAWAGVRLPTEAEWEFAATCGGKSGTKFSWGNELTVNGKYMANVWQGNDMQSAQGADGFKLTSPVGSYGLTPCGLSDMGGNVWNWCADTFKPYPGSTSDFQANPEMKAIRGGSFFFDQNGEHSFTCTFRASNSQETSLFNMGFRCAADK